MNLLIVLLLILAPVPKELRKSLPDMKTADNATLKYWAEDLTRFKQLIVWIEGPGGPDGGMVVDEYARQCLFTEGTGWHGIGPITSRYWLLKHAREIAGGRTCESNPDD